MMALSDEMRLLEAHWLQGTGWPKRLESLEIHNIRGWTGGRIKFGFPIFALVGENGSGKSTVLQSIASIFRSPAGKKKTKFASDFFPDTPWDAIRNATIRYDLLEGGQAKTGSVRKPTTRWLGNTDRPIRHVEYIDLSRILPVAGRVGYSRMAKPKYRETQSENFKESLRARAAAIIGRQYDSVRMALSDADANRWVPVMRYQGIDVSGFHQGAGEIMITELLQTVIPDYTIVLIDEIETSLHPRAQRRLMRDLAKMCKEKQLQIVVTTHSPYILEELPLEGRGYIVEMGTDLTERAVGREVVTGVSAQFAMTKMDEGIHPECDIYVEDIRAAELIREILVRFAKEIVQRCQVVDFGAASVGKSLGIMVSQNRFPRPSCVFLDGDQPPADGCSILPGGDAPERVVFKAFADRDWSDLAARTGRGFSDVVDACRQAMVIQDHHDWVRSAADRLLLSADHLWQAMCAVWVANILTQEQANTTVQPIQLALLESNS